MSKVKQKAYKDAKNTVKPTKIRVGDKVLLPRNETKVDSPYNPDPYIVTRMHGSQVEAARAESLRQGTPRSGSR